MLPGGALIPEFDNEMATTRKVLERVPEDKFGWKPHDRSMSMCELASHVANIPHWANVSIEADTFDMNPEGGDPPKAPKAGSSAELLEIFDKNVAAARAVIAGASADDLAKTWTLLSGGNEVLAFPKLVVIRGFVLNHLIHHRGQLSVYLRMNDVPVPSIYGPSADEAM